MPRPFRLTPPKPKPARTGIATHRQLVYLAHLAMSETPSLLHDQPALEDAVKYRLVKWELRVTESGYGASRRIAAAVESAIYQRRYVQLGGQAPTWREEWPEKQRRERQRRLGFR